MMEIVNFKPSSEFKEKADKLFSDQREILQKILPESDIQHIGATSIPGLLTKGDLDINVRVRQEDFDKTKETLKSLYKINQADNWTTTFASFKDDESFELPFGVQITTIDSIKDRFVRQRDTLLTRPDLIEDFNSLKLKYQNKDMTNYRTAKESFLKTNGLI